MAYGDEHRLNFSRQHIDPSEINLDNEKYEVNSNRLQVSRSEVKRRSSEIKLHEEYYKYNWSDYLMKICKTSSIYSWPRCNRRF